LPSARHIDSIRDLKPGDHVCFIYESEDEHRAVVCEYVRQGLERQQKVVYVRDANSAETICSYLADDGLDVPSFLETGQLAFLDSEAVYESEGVLDPERAISVWQSLIEDAVEQGYSALRGTAEMSWVLRLGASLTELAAYERQVDDFLLNSMCVGMGQYDWRTFDADALLEALHTYPVAVVRGQAYQNPHYVSSEELIGDDPSRAHFRHFVESLTERRWLAEEREATVELLRLINSIDQTEELVALVVGLIQDWAGCEGVGIKLLEADGSERVTASGIAEDVVFAAGAVLGAEGDNLDETLRRCACSSVLKEDYDPLGPHFTDRGTFSTDNVAEAVSSGILASDCRCSEKSESMALVPIRAAGETSGLILLSTKRTGHFTSRLVSFLERVADSLAIALRERRVQEDLRESREQLRSFTQAAPDYMMLLGPDLTIEFLNRTEPGLSIEGVLGRHICEFARDDEKEFIRRRLEQALAGQEACYYAHTYLRPSGDLVFFESRAAPVLRGGRAVGLAVNTRDVTNRRRAEDALRESERRFRSIADATPMPVAITRMSDGRILYANTAFCEAMGVTLDGVTDRAALDFYVERRQRQEVIAALKREGQLRGFEMRARRADGTEFWIMVAFQSMTFEGEEAIFGTFADITARKAAEDAVRESEAKWRSLTENSPDHIMTLDREGRILFINHTAPGLSSEDVIGTSVYEHVPEDDRDGMRASIERVLATGKSGQYECRYLYPDGQTHRFEARVGPILDGGRVVAMVVSSTDVTARKQAEDALRQSEENFRALAENAHDGILIGVGNGQHVYANRRAAEMSGYSVEELLMTSVSDLAHPDEIPKIMTRFKQRLEGGSPPKQYETVLVRKDGTDLPIELAAAATVWKGAPADLVVIRDMTERKRFEQELDKHRNELEELVKERTAELEAAHRELIEHERLATLGKLVATVNHEMRNPLMIIKGSLFTLGAGIRGRELGLEHLVERADRSVARCERIIEDLLDYTRERRPDMQRTVVDLWLGAVLDEQELPPGISLDRDLASGAELPIDQERLRRCMVNVITNACEAMTAERGTQDSPDGGDVQGRICVTSRVVDELLQIQVNDTGPGIPDEIRYKVLDPLFTTKSFGIGLGLPTVADAVRLHGGDMDVQSEIGTGTTVTMWLPVRRASAESM